MIGGVAISGIVFTLLVSLIVPVVAWIVYGVRNKGAGVWTAWLLGAAGFFVLQIMIRLPILSVLSLLSGFQTFAEQNFVVYSLILALTAAGFEAVGRFAVAWLMRKNLTYKRSIAAGLGHGGIEAIVIIGISYINNLLYAFMINAGTFDTLVEQTAAMGVDVSALIAVKEAMLGTAPMLFYLAGYERILTMVIHVALSLIMCYCVSRRKVATGFLVCMLFHGAVDFVAPLINGMTTPYLNNMLSANTAYVLVYVFLTVMAALLAAAVLKVRKLWPEAAKGITNEA